MSAYVTKKLMFNFGFLLDGLPGTSRQVEIDYPAVILDDIHLEPLTGQFLAARTAQGIYIHGTLHSNIPAECARCNVAHTHAFVIDLDDHYYLARTAPDPDSFIIHENGILDLGVMVRESAVLSRPIQTICRPDCQGLCMECGINLNTDECDCEEDDIDPRMAALKQLLDS